MKKWLTVLATVFELDDVFLWGGVLFVAVALWPDFGRRLLVVPGLLMIWLALPTRTRFIERQPPQPKKKRVE